MPETKRDRTYEEDLKFKRIRHRSKITTLIKKIKEIIAARSSRTFLKQMIKELETVVTKCREINEELCDNYSESPEVEAQWEKQFEYEEKACD